MTGINLSSSSAEKKSSKRSIFDSSFTVVTLFFIASVLVLGGTRWYIKTLDAKHEALVLTLAENSARLEGAKVDRVAHFDDRLRLTAENLASDPVDTQKLLAQIESLVVPTVRLTRYEYSAADKFVEIEGEAESFKYVAQQIISLKSERLFSEVKVQSLIRTKEGRVAFVLKADFN